MKTIKIRFEINAVHHIQTFIKNLLIIAQRS